LTFSRNCVLLSGKVKDKEAEWAFDFCLFSLLPEHADTGHLRQDVVGHVLSLSSTYNVTWESKGNARVTTAFTQFANRNNGGLVKTLPLNVYFIPKKQSPAVPDKSSSNVPSVDVSGSVRHFSKRLLQSGNDKESGNVDRCKRISPFRDYSLQELAHINNTALSISQIRSDFRSIEDLCDEVQIMDTMLVYEPIESTEDDVNQSISICTTGRTVQLDYDGWMYEFSNEEFTGNKDMILAWLLQNLDGIDRHADIQYLKQE
jgi:hypothetical protein